MTFPSCFDSRRQFQEWSQAARRCDPGDSGFCTDCTSPYQQRMVAQERCAHPATIFGIGADGGLDGRRPEQERIGYEEGA
jgi:hypothetical protein